MKVFLYGLLSWLIPFLVSIPLVRPDGGYWVSAGLFKSLMILVGCASGLWLLLRLQPNSNEPSLTRVTIVWLLINWLLDLVILLPLSGMPMQQYVVEIGLRYLTMPMIGLALDNVQSHHQRKPTPDAE